MSATPLLPDSSVRIIDEFIESVLRRVQWRAGRAWWRIDDRFAASSWVVLGSEAGALVDGVDESLDGARIRHTEPTLLATADITLPNHDREVLIAQGADHVLVVDVAADQLVDVRLVLAPPPGIVVTAEQVDSVRSAMQLVPTVFLQERSKRELGLRAHHDPLTGLLNRRGWERLLSIRTGTVLAGALMFIDLDGFKSINDRLGHRAGDEVLTAVAAALTSTVRPNDVVARIGGDEFVIFAADVADVDTALAAATRIIRTVHRDIITPSGHVVAVSASTGTSLWRAGEDPAESIAEADRLMYEAKRLGGGVATRRTDGSLRVLDVVTGQDLHGDNDPWVPSPVTVRLHRGVDAEVVCVFVAVAPTLANNPVADQVSAVMTAITATGAPPDAPITILVRGAGWTRLNRLATFLGSLLTLVGDRAQLGIVVPADTRDADLRSATEDVAREFGLERSVALGCVAGADLGALLLDGVDTVYLGPRWARSPEPIVGESAARDALVGLTLALGQTLVLVDTPNGELFAVDTTNVASASTRKDGENKS
jgi:diguanylate cyclase (GGDEF)-like protein